MADDELRRSVSDELSSDPRITVDADIRVSVADGEVTLQGTVDTYRDKREAVTVAQRVPRVTIVKDEIVVVGRTDPDLRRDVLDELEIGHIPVTFDVEVHEGTVTLAGSVERQHDRDAAGYIAKVVPGVVGVENQLQAKGGSRHGEGVADVTREDVIEIGELDAGGVGADGYEARRELGERLAAAARRIEQLRAAADGGGNVVQFRLERYLEALESDAVDIHSRLAGVSDVRSYEGKLAEREIIALETGLTVAEAKLDAARAEERDDHRGEVDAEVRAMKAEARGIRAHFDRTFGKDGAG